MVQEMNARSAWNYICRKKKAIDRAIDYTDAIVILQELILNQKLKKLDIKKDIAISFINNINKREYHKFSGSPEEIIEYLQEEFTPDRFQYSIGVYQVFKNDKCKERHYIGLKLGSKEKVINDCGTSEILKNPLRETTLEYLIIIKQTGSKP